MDLFGQMKSICLCGSLSSHNEICKVSHFTYECWFSFKERGNNRFIVYLWGSAVRPDALKKMSISPQISRAIRITSGPRHFHEVF